jgi:hypothetical protein
MMMSILQIHRRLGGSSSPLLDVTNVGGAEKYLASPDGAADPPLLRI